MIVPGRGSWLILILHQLCDVSDAQKLFPNYEPPQTTVSLSDVFGDKYARKLEELASWVRKRTAEAREAEKAPARKLHVQWLEGCVVNAFVATEYLTEAGLSITSSVADCADKADCAVGILAAMQSFINTGAYLAGLADSCGQVANVEALCASSVLGVVGGTVELAFAIAALVDQCRFVERRLDVPGNRSNDGRFLAGRTPIDPEQLSIAWCVINAIYVPTYIAQASILIVAATEDCPDQSTREDQAGCASDVTGVIASFANVAAYSSAIATSCTLKRNIDADCAALSGTLVNALAGIASAGASMVNTCEYLDKQKSTQSFDYQANFPNASAVSQSQIVVR